VVDNSSCLCIFDHFRCSDRSFPGNQQSNNDIIGSGFDSDPIGCCTGSDLRSIQKNIYQKKTQLMNTEQDLLYGYLPDSNR
jgi:hypothetical protein